jgi:hypothetical protein
MGSPIGTPHTTLAPRSPKSPLSRIGTAESRFPRLPTTPETHGRIIATTPNNASARATGAATSTINNMNDHRKKSTTSNGSVDVKIATLGSRAATPTSQAMITVSTPVSISLTPNHATAANPATGIIHLIPRHAPTPSLTINIDAKSFGPSTPQGANSHIIPLHPSHQHTHSTGITLVGSGGMSTLASPAHHGAHVVSPSTPSPNHTTNGVTTNGVTSSSKDGSSTPTTLSAGTASVKSGGGVVSGIFKLVTRASGQGSAPNSRRNSREGVSPNGTALTSHTSSQKGAVVDTRAPHDDNGKPGNKRPSFASLATLSGAASPFSASSSSTAVVENGSGPPGLSKRASYETKFPRRMPAADTGWRLDDFDLAATLGTGSFGRVRLCRHKPTAQVYAIKILKKKEILRLKQVITSFIHLFFFIFSLNHCMTTLFCVTEIGGAYHQ